ncbi:tetratricopeptide repeat protein [Ornithinibacillus contaminans]|uniref:tetratricopeptide repeat protein n=1 Tax=Ornithinibacillus contaminans TaxID=694055 RepID=UPI00064DC12B|nr:tetratricopeptide repeat protein [Ornithinibacillus contaminans]
MQQVDNKNKLAKLNNVIPFIPDGDFYFAKGVESFRKRKFDIALKWLTKAVESAPKNPLYQCQMSIIYTETGAFHKANQILTNVLQATGDQYVDCYYLLANNYAHLGLLNDAKKFAVSYLDKEPNGDFSEDAKTLLQLIEIDDDFDDEDWDFEDEDELLVFQETVFHHLENKEWDKALTLLEEMLVLFPDHKTAQHEYAHALFFSGKKEEAIQKELELVEADPNNLFSHTNLALFYYEIQSEQEYQLHIRALLNIYPIHEQQKLRIATTLARTGYLEEAYARFRMLDKAAVNSHISYFRWYSMTAFRLGEPSKALSLWEEGCRRFPKLSEEDGPWTS